MRVRRWLRRGLRAAASRFLLALWGQHSIVNMKLARNGHKCPFMPILKQAGTTIVILLTPQMPCFVILLTRGTCDRRMTGFHPHHNLIMKWGDRISCVRFCWRLRVKGRKGKNYETNDETYGDVNWMSDAGRHAGVRVCAGR